MKRICYPLLLFVSSLIIFAGTVRPASADGPSDTGTVYPVEITPFLGLNESDLGKIKDPDLLEFVTETRALPSTGAKTSTVLSREFKVFLAYEPEMKETLHEQAEQLDIDRIYFYKYSSLVSVQAPVEKIALLLQNNAVITSVESDTAAQTFSFTLGSDAEQLTNIGAVHQAGLDGEGTYIAIIDTGLDANNPEFGGRVAYEHCWTSEYFYDPVGLFEAYPSCKSPSGSSPVTESSSAYPFWGDRSDFRQFFNHGSHVAGIAAGNGGVAPKANIIALQVFSLEYGFDPERNQWNYYSISYLSNQIQALEYLVDLKKNGVNIVAANMSFGGLRYESYCDNDLRKPLIDLLAELGVTAVVAAGNSYWTGYTSAPACVSSAFSVGAVWNNGDHPELADFSNINHTVDLLAPGVAINSTKLDGSFVSWDGTSMATPMVSGAIALIAGKAPESGGVYAQTFLQRTSNLNAQRGMYTQKVLNFSNTLSAINYLNEPYWAGGGLYDGVQARSAEIERLAQGSAWQW